MKKIFDILDTKGADSFQKIAFVGWCAGDCKNRQTVKPFCLDSRSVERQLSDFGLGEYSQYLLTADNSVLSKDACVEFERRRNKCKEYISKCREVGNIIR